MHVRITSAALLWLWCAAALADDRGYALGAGVAVDDGDGVSVSVLADYSFNDAASVFANFASTQAAALPDDITTRDWSVGARYDFGPLGFDISGGQSGDPDDFDAEDLSLGVFHRGARWSGSLRYLQRDIDVVLRTELLRNAVEFVAPLEATGWRGNIAYRTEKRWRWSVTARRFDYDRDLSVLGGRFITRRISPTSLTLASALLDDSISAGLEIPLANSRAINLQLGRDTLAGELGEIRNASVGWLTPLGKRGDLDLSVGVSDGNDALGQTTIFFSALYLFYGGF
ncbi:MAG: hypothetical protein AAFO81_03520 [Pseudomonadota bacterium]